MKIRQKIILNFLLLLVPGYLFAAYLLWQSASNSGLQTIIVLVLFCFSVILSIYLSGLLVKPIKSLKKTAEDLRLGSASRLEIQGNGEFSEIVRNVNSKLEQSNKNENLLENTQKELKAALEQIYSLEKRTNGEYFLVSRLLKPLIINHVKSDTIRVNFLVSQQKKFQFEKIGGEIGGDISIAHNIILKNKNYVVFINGDAIGKSLQGAQGALIAGIIFNEFITRTRVSVNQQNRFPEKWLRECYRAMQSAFVTFNFELMISAVIGLVDEKNGFVYYFNARHPSSVLYRNGKAQFLEDGLSLYKIGVEGLGDVFNLRTFQMQNEDVLLFGSDGRDTITLKDKNKNQERTLNEDETFFLKCVEKGEGDVGKILNSIEDHGELSDDITLLSVSYHTDVDLEEAQKRNPAYSQFVQRAKEFIRKRKYIEAAQKLERAIKIFREPDVYKDLLYCYRKINDYEKQESAVREAYNSFPHVIEFSLHASELYKRLKRFETAIDHGERYRLYYPNDVKNLVNLADIYRLVRNYARAKMILDEIETIDSKNEGYLKMKSLLEKSESNLQ
ncbi:MAG: SpoIIE family protein phosphatase [Leptospiraceae bacterium]|nr:SpoIIE family protein phosphatase [Leptospiraceae bacterium]MCP5494640.1 SpoIIE family protein phosphatase [Leptospiraceae bacterium]